MAGNLKAFLAEFVGTFGLVFFGAGAACMDAASGGRIGLAGVAAAQGLAGALFLYIYARSSGGHFNPAVSFALILNGRLHPGKGLFYVIAQLLGASLAGLFLQSVAHGRPELLSQPPFLGAVGLADAGFRLGTLLEAIGTFFLVTAFYAALVDPRGEPAVAPLAVGLTYALALLAFGPLTGAALNPARAFGTAVPTGRWEHWFVYWIGPLAGAYAAAQLYELLYLEKKK